MHHRLGQFIVLCLYRRFSVDKLGHPQAYTQFMRVTSGSCSAKQTFDAKTCKLRFRPLESWSVNRRTNLLGFLSYPHPTSLAKG